MTRIGLISDTHSYLDDAVFKHFENCDEIWHAGDFGTIELADRLAAFKPLKGVYGNIDDKDVRIVYPEHLRFKCEEVDVWMTHIGGYPGRYSQNIKAEIYSNPPKLFITGHSHILKVMFDKKINCLHMNPGAAGKQGWHKVRTLLRFNVDGDKIQDLQVIELVGKIPVV
ncbi:putative phosphoesterase [Mucilaginibacter rubeus]|uniref:metallophosphoesterase family protein n=1 Tax=Mucilaginibacter rubeus TaxID=2027860 RepID=UPI003390CA79